MVIDLTGTDATVAVIGSMLRVDVHVLARRRNYGNRFQWQSIHYRCRYYESVSDRQLAEHERPI